MKTAIKRLLQIKLDISGLDIELNEFNSKASSCVSLAEHWIEQALEAVDLEKEKEEKDELR